MDVFLNLQDAKMRVFGERWMAEYMINFGKVGGLAAKSWLSTGKALEPGRSRSLSPVLQPVAPDNAIAYRSTHREVVDFSGAGRDDDVPLIHPDSALRSTPPLLHTHLSTHLPNTLHTTLKPLQLHTTSIEKPLRLQA